MNCRIRGDGRSSSRGGQINPAMDPASDSEDLRQIPSPHHYQYPRQPSVQVIQQLPPALPTSSPPLLEDPLRPSTASPQPPRPSSSSNNFNSSNSTNTNNPQDDSVDDVYGGSLASGVLV